MGPVLVLSPTRYDRELVSTSALPNNRESNPNPGRTVIALSISIAWLQFRDWRSAFEILPELSPCASRCDRRTTRPPGPRNSCMSSPLGVPRPSVFLASHVAQACPPPEGGKPFLFCPACDGARADAQECRVCVDCACWRVCFRLWVLAMVGSTVQ